MFLTFYIVTVTGNIIIIMLVSTSLRLNSPMYFFLCHLSLCDILLTTNIVPKMLRVILADGCTISLAGCFTQFYFFGVSTITECLLLTVMSFDRYLAIYSPLRYISIMGLKLRLCLVIWSWFLGFMLPLIEVVSILKLHFCGPNVIDHFFCDFAPLLRLSCSDTSIVQMENLVLSIPVALLPFVIMIVTYICIFVTILQISSTTGRQKAFFTCSSQLAVVSMYYGALISIYLVPSGGRVLNLTKFVSLVYTVVAPLVNPVIYSLRNCEIQTAMKEYIKSRRRMDI
ncbi:hypothetical protein FKM82_007387 [Ascaphus truei]